MLTRIFTFIKYGARKEARVRRVSTPRTHVEHTSERASMRTRDILDHIPYIARAHMRACIVGAKFMIYCRTVLGDVDAEHCALLGEAHVCFGVVLGKKDE